MLGHFEQRSCIIQGICGLCKGQQITNSCAMPFGMILFLFANMGSIQNLQMRNHIYELLAPPPLI